MNFTKVKICGITNVEDALAAVNAGADALGFMFYEISPRYVTPALAAEIIGTLPPLVSKVGVFVNANAEKVRRVAEECGLDTLQFHGKESPVFCRQFPLKVIKAFRILDVDSLNGVARYGREAWLFDSYVKGKPGGTGERFNWDLAIQATRETNKLFLAGGLTPTNVAEAVSKVRPYAVDVSSGVESRPGRKNHESVRLFIAAAKQ